MSFSVSDALSRLKKQGDLHASSGTDLRTSAKNQKKELIATASSSSTIAKKILEEVPLRPHMPERVSDSSEVSPLLLNLPFSTELSSVLSNLAAPLSPHRKLVSGFSSDEEEASPSTVNKSSSSFAESKQQPELSSPNFEKRRREVGLTPSDHHVSFSSSSFSSPSRAYPLSHQSPKTPTGRSNHPNSLAAPFAASSSSTHTSPQTPKLKIPTPVRRSAVIGSPAEYHLPEYVDNNLGPDGKPNRELRRALQKLQKKKHNSVAIGSAKRDPERIRRERRQPNEFGNFEISPSRNSTSSPAKKRKRLWTMHPANGKDGLNSLIPVKGPNILPLSGASLKSLAEAHIAQPKTPTFEEALLAHAKSSVKAAQSSASSSSSPQTE